MSATLPCPSWRTRQNQAEEIPATLGKTSLAFKTNNEYEWNKKADVCQEHKEQMTGVSRGHGTVVRRQEQLLSGGLDQWPQAEGTGAR